MERKKGGGGEERKKGGGRETGARERVDRVDPYGFQRSEDFDYESYEQRMSEYLVVLTRRAIKWSKLLKGNAAVHKSAKLKRYVRKGVPNRHRSLVWMASSGAQDRLDQNPGYYHTVLGSQHDSKLLESVRTDLNRTFPDNVEFRRSSGSGSGSGLLTSLNNVLLAYGRHNPAVGYCQGMNFIAGFLLIITRDEEKTFWLMDALLGRILPDYYSPSMLGLKVDLEVLGELVKVRLPAVWQQMDDQQVKMDLVASRWFICLYVDVLPVETVLRVWDCLFYEGSKILFRVALTLLRRHQTLVLQASSLPDVCQVFKRITRGPVVDETHAFMQRIFIDPGSLSRDFLSKLRASCRARILAEES